MNTSESSRHTPSGSPLTWKLPAPDAAGLRTLSCSIAGAFLFLAFSSIYGAARAEDHIPLVNLAEGQMLRLRAAPDGDAEVLAYIPFDSKELKLAGECKEEWCNVTFRGMTGWSFKKYLDVTGATPSQAGAPGAVRYRASGLSDGQQLIIRGNPDQEGDPLGIIPPGATGIEERGGCKQGWCRVYFKNALGWVEQRYLAKEGGYAGSAPAQTAAAEPVKQDIAVPAGPVKRYRVEGVLADQPLTIRDAADPMATVTGLIPADAKDIEGLKRCATKWCLVRYSGVTGWTLRRYLADMDLAKPKRFKVTGLEISDTLTVREYPAEAADAVGTIPAFGTGIVQIGECGGEWCHVRFLGTVGWVNSEYIAAEGRN